jgi:hypothetical protein
MRRRVRVWALLTTDHDETWSDCRGATEGFVEVNERRVECNDMVGLATRAIRFVDDN